MGRDDTEMGGAAIRFPDTVWSRIVQARDGGGADRTQGLNDLVAAYWKPVYSYLRRGAGCSNEEAKDLTQEFLATMLERDFLKNLAPEKGSFRGFLKTSLKRFVIDAERTRGRQKRGSGALPMSLDFEGAGDALSDGGASTPEASFDREWTRTLVAQAVGRLQARLEGEGRKVRYEVFQAYDLEAADCSYSELGRRLGLTEAEVRHHLSHARELFRQILRGCVAEYVTSDEELAQELRELFGE
jgi:RNA polymerase sigma factor (sigma-70 family)